MSDIHRLLGCLTLLLSATPLSLAGCESRGDGDSDEASAQLEGEAIALAANAAAPPCGALLASIDGVGAYSNGASQGTLFSCGGVDLYDFKWQCTELARRYFATCFHAGYWLVVDAYRMCDVAGLGTTVHMSGSGYHPVHGDLMVIDHSAASSAGHVAVIDSVSGSEASVVEENASLTGRASRSLSSARCFLHADENDGNQAPSCAGLLSL